MYLSEALRGFTVESSDLWDNNCEYIFSSLIVCPVVGQRQPEEDGLLSLRTPIWTDFGTVVKKELYLLSVKVANLHSLAGVKASRWTEIFGGGTFPGSCWRSLHKPPIDKKIGDLQCRLCMGP